MVTIPEIVGISFSRDKGVQVIGNDHMYPLVLWGGGGGRRGSLILHASRGIFRRDALLLKDFRLGAINGVYS